MRSHSLCCNSIVSNYAGLSETRTRLILFDYWLDWEITGWNSMVYRHNLNIVILIPQKLLHIFSIIHSKTPNHFHAVHFRKICRKKYIVPKGKIDCWILKFSYISELQSCKSKGFSDWTTKPQYSQELECI